MAPLLEKRGAHGSSWVSPESVLLGKRTVMLTKPVSDESAAEVIAQLAALDIEEVAPITLIICSPGGSVSAGLSIIDCMNGIESPVRTVGTGCVASMAAVVLACGERGVRMATPNAQILIHQPSMAGLGGQASDIAIAAEAIVGVKSRLNGLLAQQTGLSKKKIEQMTERDTWLTPEDALKQGFVDAVEPLSFAR